MPCVNEASQGVLPAWEKRWISPLLVSGNGILGDASSERVTGTSRKAESKPDSKVIQSHGAQLRILGSLRVIRWTAFMTALSNPLVQVISDKSKGDSYAY